MLILIHSVCFHDLQLVFFFNFRDECFRILEGFKDFHHYIPLEVKISVFSLSFIFHDLAFNRHEIRIY